MKLLKARYFFALFTAAALGLSMTSAVSASGNDETTYLQMKQDLGYMGYTTDNSLDLSSASFLYGQLYPVQFRDHQGQKLFICNSTQSAGCADPANSLWFHANFAQCSSPTDTDCIEQFGVVNPDKTITNATFVKEYKQGGVFSADPSIKLPAGHGQNVWSIQDSSGTQLYGLQVGVDGSYLRTDPAVSYYGFGAAVQPIYEVTGDGYIDPAPQIVARTYGDGWGIDNTAVLKGCAVFTTNTCGVRESFDPAKTFILKVRLHTGIKGWLHGRMKDAAITLENTSDGGQILTVQAKSMQVPVLSGWVKWANLTPALQTRYPVGSGGFARVLSDFTNPDLNTRTLQVESQVAGQNALDEINGWLPLLGNKASNMKSYWTVKTISGQLPFDLSKCPNASGVTGFIGTNASVYSDGPPTLDSSTGTLNYTVAAPHYDSNGDVFGGIYQLSLRSDIARCIYNFTKAPISAKVEISSSDGAQRIATTSVNESNGWLNLVASGFEFSSPTVKVKLTQDAVPVTPKRTTITCIKGKSTKSVTSVKPTCPTGYKKK
jgi:hypothetical protein